MLKIQGYFNVYIKFSVVFRLSIIVAIVFVSTDNFIIFHDKAFMKHSHFFVKYWIMEQFIVYLYLLIY